MNDLQRSRMMELADALDAMPPSGFDLRWWALSAQEAEEIAVPGLEILGAPPPCGSVVCAMGKAAGLWPGELRLVIDDSPAGVCQLAHVAQFGRRLYGFPAAARFFGISSEDAARLFDAERYPLRGATPPWEVAKRLREFAGGA